MNETGPDDLTAKLRAWKIEPQVPSSFQREVWQRIALRQMARENGFWPRLIQWLGAQWIRPRYVFTTVVFSLVVGMGGAHLQAQQTKARLWRTLEARYAASVDPLAMSR